MNVSILIRLSAMMFGQFFIWGVWFVTLGSYLTSIGFQGVDIGRAYSTTAIGAVVSAFFVSLIADRYFAAEKLTALLHLSGAALMYWASTIHEPGLFFWVLLAYALCYSPTLALTTAIGMRHCTDSQQQFPRIRVFGTLGWIVAGLGISFFGIENGPEPMRIAAGTSVLMGILCFFLPHTPPLSRDRSLSVRAILGLDALRLMKSRSFLVLCISSLVITLPFAMYHPFTNMYLNFLGVSNVAAKMTMAQMSEVIFMVMMPFFFRHLGIKRMLLIGLAAWVVRFVLFSFGNADALFVFLLVGILLHGVCYDFFYVSAQIYMDQKAPPDLRASVQGFFTLLTWGVGWLIGSLLGGSILQSFQIVDEQARVVGHHWSTLLLIPAGIAAIVVVFFAFLFTDDPKPGESPRRVSA